QPPEITCARHHAVHATPPPAATRHRTGRAVERQPIFHYPEVSDTELIRVSHRAGVHAFWRVRIDAFRDGDHIAHQLCEAVGAELGQHPRYEPVQNHRHECFCGERTAGRGGHGVQTLCELAECDLALTVPEGDGVRGHGGRC